MLNLEQIILFGEQHGLGKGRERQALAEYLQALILQILLKSNNSNKLSFMGGTSLRFFYGLPRFSEDLDFDNFSLLEEEFFEMMGFMKKELILRGFVIDSLVKIKGAYHCYFRFANLLYNNKLSEHIDEKILIKIDTVEQDFSFEPERRFFNRYGIVEEVQVNPKDILMAQKTLALLGRKRAKGRDFFDFIFLDGITKPNIAYLQEKGNIVSLVELKKLILEKCDDLDFDLLARDVAPFLLYPDDINKVKKFKEYIEQWEV